MRSPAGWIFPPALGLAVIALDRLGKPSHHQLAVQVLGVQTCISIWRSFDYLFSSSGYVGGRSAQSDTATIADALLALLVLGRGHQRRHRRTAVVELPKGVPHLTAACCRRQVLLHLHGSDKFYSRYYEALLKMRL